MFAILKKEINTFFASPIGYFVVAVFLLLNGLFLWGFDGDFNILNFGFADLSSFFLLAPWVLTFLIPAVTMRSFAEEKKQGTLELLLTKPISYLQLVLGKYFGALLLIFIALIPTLLYVYTIYNLGDPAGNLDMASTIGSYIGLLFLVASYTAIGVFCSSCSQNQIVAFICAIFLCFLFYIGFEGIAEFTSQLFLEQLGMSAHFKSVSRGVLDSRDIIYFLSVTVFFIIITTYSIRTEKLQRSIFTKIALLLIALILFNIANYSFFLRADLTQDKRYTLSNASVNIIKDIESPILVDVFLEGEDFPSEFRRLKRETKQMLEEFSAKNNNIHFNFINPIQDEANKERNIKQLNARGLKPMLLGVNERGKSSETVIFPWALASYNNKTVSISLIKNKIGASQQELVTNSVQHLEYAFADGFSKLTQPKKRKIAILKGNNQLEDKYITDFVRKLGSYYFIAPFTLDSTTTNPQKTLKDLNAYDLIISAKPTEPFTEKEKLVLDQYTMQGGKSLWLIDAVGIEKDSLHNATGSSFALARDLNLTSLFFNYGIRVNPVMVSTPYSAPITLAMGTGSESQYQHLKWPYAPLAASQSKHPILHNLNLVKFDFANQIDTLKNKINKTILLQSAPLTRLEGVPREVSLSVVTKTINPKTFNKGKQTLAVLLEGAFTSAYKSKVKPFKLDKNIEESLSTKMVVIADGDVIKNDVINNKVQELGFDRWTGKTYGNKEFLLNTVNYLLDDDGLINIRSKEIKVAFLDQQKIIKEKTKWQVINILIPILLLALFGFIFNYRRTKKYSR